MPVIALPSENNYITVVDGPYKYMTATVLSNDKELTCESYK